MKTILRSTLRLWRSIRRYIVCTALIASIAPVQVLASSPVAPTVERAHPGLVRGVLKSAELIELPGDILAETDQFQITGAALDEGIQGAEFDIRPQIKKNLLFVLESLVTKRLLLHQAYAAGYSRDDSDDEVIRQLLHGVAAGVTVSDQEVKDYYLENREAIYGIPFEKAKEPLEAISRQEKQRQAITDYTNALGERIPIRLDTTWFEKHRELAADNPVDKARRSGRPTMVEFGSDGCRPCDLMQPIVDRLRKKYAKRLNIVFIHVREEQILSTRYGVSSIPVQVFFDKTGREFFRHVGFFSEEEIEKIFTQMGVS